MAIHSATQMESIIVKICVTGASGFIGRHLCRQLKYKRIPFRAVSRKSMAYETVSVGDINAETNWQAALEGVDTVIHLAARVHQMKESAHEKRLYDVVNHHGTQHLVDDCIARGVKRFVFVSTIKVLGEGCKTPFNEESLPQPTCPYSESKYKAEQALEKACSDAGMEWVIVRPPLIYGPGAAGNIPRLLKLVQRFPILPLGGIANARSMISVENFSAMLIRCATHPNAPGHRFLIQDNGARSTTELIEDIANVLNKRLWMPKLPTALLEQTAKVLGRQPDIQRLTGSLAVDDALTRTLLDWVPPYAYLDQLALLATVPQEA